jgi:hypothetical protein
MSPEFAEAVRVLKMGDDAVDGKGPNIALGVPDMGRTCAASPGRNRGNASINCNSHQNASHVIAADVGTGRFHRRTSQRPRHGDRAQTNPLTDSYREVHLRLHRLRLRRAVGVPYSLERWYAEGPQHGPITTSLVNERRRNRIGAKAPMQDTTEPRQGKITDQDTTVSLAGSWFTNLEG